MSPGPGHSVAKSLSIPMQLALVRQKSDFPRGQMALWSGFNPDSNPWHRPEQQTDPGGQWWDRLSWKKSKAKIKKHITQCSSSSSVPAGVSASGVLWLVGSPIQRGRDVQAALIIQDSSGKKLLKRQQIVELFIQFLGGPISQTIRKTITGMILGVDLAKCQHC